MSLSEWWLVMLILALTIQINQAFILLTKHAWNKPIATYDIK